MFVVCNGTRRQYREFVDDSGGGAADRNCAVDHSAWLLFYAAPTPLDSTIRDLLLLCWASQITICAPTMGFRFSSVQIHCGWWSSKPLGELSISWENPRRLRHLSLPFLTGSWFHYWSILQCLQVLSFFSCRSMLCIPSRIQMIRRWVLVIFWNDKKKTLFSFLFLN